MHDIGHPLSKETVSLQTYRLFVTKLHETDECFNYLSVADTRVYNDQSSEVLANCVFTADLIKHYSNDSFNALRLMLLLSLC